MQVKRISSYFMQTLKVSKTFRVWNLPAYYKSAAVFLAFIYLSTACVGYTPLGPLYPLKTSRIKNTQPVSATVSPGGKREATPTPQATLGLEAAILIGKTVQFWYPRSADRQDIFPILGKEFNKNNPWGITVEMAAQENYDDLVKAVQNALYGDTPDLWLGYSHHVLRVDQAGDGLVDLSPYVDDPKWGYSAVERQDYLPLFWEQDIYQEAGRPERRLGIPLYSLAQVLFYNATWARELGFLAPPSDVEKFKNQACAAARFNQRDDNPQNDGTGGWVIDTDSSTMLGWISAFGGNITGGNITGGNIAGGNVAGVGEDSYQFNTPETERAFGFLRELYENGCSWVGLDRYPNQELADRRALFISSSASGLSSQEEAFKTAGATDRWTAIPFPSEDGGGVIDVYGPSLAILKSTPEKQLAAWLFLKWLASPEIQARWTKIYGTLPTRISARDLLSGYQKSHPQWAALLDLYPLSRTEPRTPSWETVQWILSDAGAQLFSPAFSAGQIPGLLEMLDQTVDELEAQFK